ncbi:MAG: protein kinase [Acidobacteria bacterium]|nr:protein kinase [Acidobacteriota bacterium]
MTLAPGTKLGPYEILAPIGAGGMGEVYKARDTRLGRIVAVKKVREQHSERFKQEARSIAALNHPNICQIFDIGDDYLVLEYVGGKPLSSPLPEEEAVKLAIQIVTALEAAHKKGIIHRDLKPGNIMVSDEGTVKLLDFGLAKLYEQDQSISSLPTADFPATQAGAILGTVTYMSPEQAQGQPADARSDIFSFGLVLYEMLSGRRAFSGDSNYAVLDAIVKQEPFPLQTSPTLEKIVKRCLEKKPSERYQAVSDVKAALERTVKPKGILSSEESLPSIAVLPFVNMSGDKEQEYFSDGLAEEIINALTKIPGLKVIARTSAFSFKGKEQDIRKIAEALNVSNILEGSVRKAGNRIRVTAQLITASDGSHLWSERYDREMEDVFAIQDDISEAITEKLRVQLSRERHSVKSPTENVEAYNLYLKGRYHFTKMIPEGWEKSKECYEQALAIDPRYALAWYGLAYYFSFLGYNGFIPSEEAVRESRHAALKALEFDENLSEAHSILGELSASEFDWKGAEREYRLALRLNPRSIDNLIRYAIFYLVPMKRFDEALEASKLAAAQDPLSPHSQQMLGIFYIIKRQYDRAIAQLNNVRELDPQYLGTYIWLGQAYFLNGDHKEGFQVLKKFQAEFPGIDPFPLGALGYVCAKTGNIKEAKEILEDLRNHARKSHENASSFALIHLGLGEVEKGFDYLIKAAAKHESMIHHIIYHPFLDSIRTHPRYKALLRKMKLEP